MSISVCVPGITGKMGMEIARLVLLDNTNIRLSSGIARDLSKLNKSSPNIYEEIITSDLNEAISRCDVCVDFTRPAYCMDILNECVKQNKKLVIGTTGFSEDQISKIHSASKKISILKASNMSVGINLCLKLVEKVSSSIGNVSDIDIIEHHHKHKVDMPSGTSLAFEDAIKNNMTSKKDINHHCLRVGNVVGDHMVKFTLENESIEINHKSFDRKIFAEGAILALKWISNKDKGLYTMSDALSL
jgi:4-hydroxy-tetrahydrodipicolinate reductase